MIQDIIIKDNIPVVEINLEQNIKHGYTITLLEKSEIALPALLTELIRLKSNKN